MPIPYTITPIDDCSDLSSWTKVQPGQPNWYEDDNSSNRLTGTKSFRFQADASATVNSTTLTKNIAHNFNPIDKIGMINLVRYKPLATSLGFTFYGSDQINMGAAGVGRWNRPVGSFGNIGAERMGWQLYPLDFAHTIVESGAPTINLNYLSMRIAGGAHPTSNREAWVDSFCKYSSRPAVIFQFDDGTLTSYTEGFAYANPRGIPLTHFIIHDLIDVNPSFYLTKAQALEMHNNGDLLGSHGNGTNAWENNPQDIITDTESLRDMFGLPFKHGAYPNGAYGQNLLNYSEIEAKISDAGLETVRTVANAPLFAGAYSPNYLPATLNLNSGVSLAQAKAELDRCIKHGLTCIIIGHKLEAVAAASTWAISDWRSLIDYVVNYIKLGMLDAMTIEEWQYGSKIPR